MKEPTQVRLDLPLERGDAGDWDPRFGVPRWDPEEFERQCEKRHWE